MGGYDGKENFFLTTSENIFKWGTKLLLSYVWYRFSLTFHILVCLVCSFKIDSSRVVLGILNLVYSKSSFWVCDTHCSWDTHGLLLKHFGSTWLTQAQNINLLFQSKNSTTQVTRCGARHCVADVNVRCGCRTNH